MTDPTRFTRRLRVIRDRYGYLPTALDRDEVAIVDQVCREVMDPSWSDLKMPVLLIQRAEPAPA